MLFTEETTLSILYDPQDAVHPHNSFPLPPLPSLVCSGYYSLGVQKETEETLLPLD